MKKRKSESPTAALAVPIEIIERRIYLIRSQKVMLASDLAELYQVPTKALNQAVRRNMDRFPPDFMLQLTHEEASVLRSQFVTLEKGRGRYSKYAPLAFTEHGVAMLSSVLNSKRAVQVNILIMRAFVKLREMLATHKDLARKLEELEKKYQAHDVQIQAVFDAIRKLIEEPSRRRRRIGFAAEPEK
jgi:hypothetical protein